MMPSCLRSAWGPGTAGALFLPALVALSLLAGCGDDGTGRPLPDAGQDLIVDDGGVQCVSQDVQGCVGNTLYTCVQNGEFLEPEPTDCGAEDKVCVEGLGCVTCRPDEVTCRDNDVVRCNAEGSGFEVMEECNLEEGLVCRDSQCKNLCQVAQEDRSYQGCEFYAADLDNAAIAAGRDASRQQYAVVVSNPSSLETEVTVEVNDAAFGEEREIREVASTTLVPGDLEVFDLPRREVDGSSSNKVCTNADQTCPRDEVCVCPSGDDGEICHCRLSEDSSGRNDGTHTAVSSQAYRITSDLPIIAYQFNPLDNVGVFSNDASMLMPTSAIGNEYTVVGWPQTLATERDRPRDLRATLTILGTREETNVQVTAGQDVDTVVGAEPIPQMGPGDEFDLEIGPFDVINLETEGFNADFTSTRIEANKPVTVFTGSEASDVPRYDSYTQRQCCADHLEEQLFPDSTLGSRFVIARMPPRTEALNDAFIDSSSVAEVNEPEWVRIVATSEGETRVLTTKPAPDDEFVLEKGENTIVEADQDFEMHTENSKPIAVLQALPSQQAVGIPNELPGGDPAVLAVPPAEQWRQDYVFLTPDQYAFDFVTIVADRQTRVRLDGEPLDSQQCTTAPADGIERSQDDPPPEQVIHRCQLSFPDVQGQPNVKVMDGVQADGVHSVVADGKVAVLVYGFDAFVSYAYVAGLDLKPIPR
jgi:hypothetical protein